MSEAGEVPRIAVCGAGQWGKNHVRNFAELGALSAICDSNPELLRKHGEAHGDVRLTDDLDSILQDAEIDGVVLATPAETHHPLGLRALRAGKDVLIEKPLALRVEDGEELVATAAELGRVLMVGHILDYHPAVEALLGLVRSGALGKVQYVYSNRLNLGKVRREENILWSFAPHDISLITGIVGGEPDAVSASGGAWLQPHIADVTVTNLEFPGGVRGHVFVSWLHPMKEQRLVVVGSKAMAVFDDMQPREGKLVTYEHGIDWIDHQPVPRKAEGKPVPIGDDEPLRRECSDFLTCITTREVPRSDGRNGLAVLRVLSAAQASLEAGGVPVPLQRGEASAPAAAATTWQAHETAVIDEGATIGTGTSIWHHAHVMGGAVIGEGCVLGQNVFVASDVTLGNNVRIQNNVSIYDGVVLEDDVFCGPSMVFTNVSIPRSHHPRRGEYETTRVRRGASLGANSTVVCGLTIHPYSFVGAGAVVTKDVPAHALVVGNPARVRGWRCICGEGLPFEGLDQGEEAGVACGGCGRSYARDGAVVTAEAAE